MTAGKQQEDNTAVPDSDACASRSAFIHTHNSRNAPFWLQAFGSMAKTDSTAASLPLSVVDSTSSNCAAERVSCASSAFETARSSSRWASSKETARACAARSRSPTSRSSASCVRGLSCSNGRSHPAGPRASPKPQWVDMRSAKVRALRRSSSAPVVTPSSPYSTSSAALPPINTSIRARSCEWSSSASSSACSIVSPPAPLP
mmetsp:Transcript_13228/g.19917  ORF Transcript_13228/g.19917 Transcript_13228/m.19917 type:complete len:203 (+) Transcript_13228:134-742(+)